MKLLFFTVFIFMGLTMGVDAQADPYARDLVKLVEFFEGEFDNDSQMWFEGRRGWPGKEEEKHIRMHATHTRIDASDIGDIVFYVEEFTEGDPAKISRQRVVNFKSDIDKGGVVMEIYFLNDADKFVNAQDSMAVFNDLGQDDLFGLDGCHVVFKREGDQFFGSMEDKMCQFGEGEKKRYSVHNVHLSATKYWRVDQTYLVENDEFYMGHPNDEPYKMRKARKYRCDVSFTEKGYYDPSGNDKKYSDIILHDQGGTATLYNPIKEKNYILQLREKEYPYYSTGSDFFMLRFIEEGATRSDVIVTSEPHVSKISFSLGWASASCYLEEQ